MSIWEIFVYKYVFFFPFVFCKNAFAIAIPYMRYSQILGAVKRCKQNSFQKRKLITAREYGVRSIPIQRQCCVCLSSIFFKKHNGYRCGTQVFLSSFSSQEAAEQSTNKNKQLLPHSLTALSTKQMPSRFKAERDIARQHHAADLFFSNVWTL